MTGTGLEDHTVWYQPLASCLLVVFLQRFSLRAAFVCGLWLHVWSFIDLFLLSIEVRVSACDHYQQHVYRLLRTR